MEKKDYINKEVTLSVSRAIESFMSKNGLKEDEINVTVIDPAKKVIIRIFNWNVESNREAEHTIYHGDHYDVFVWNCVTRTSGILEYDDVLTDEYHYKCSE